MTAENDERRVMAEETSSELVRRHDALARVSGSARSTSSIGFDATVLRWSDLPVETRQAARHRGPVVAEQGGADDTLYVLEPEIVQVMRAWRAYRDRVYVGIARRPVLLVDPGWQPIGPWKHVALRQYEVVGEPRRRVGWVPPGAAPGAAGGGGPAGGRSDPAPQVPPDQSDAAGAWVFLPAAVRESAMRAVPAPVDWLGNLIQVSDARRTPLSQELTMLRRDDERAVVVKATREVVPRVGLTPSEQAAELAAADWLVEQIVMTIARPPELEATRPDEGFPWS